MRTAPTFDEQLAAFAAAGIRPREGVLREALLYNWPESAWQERPWKCLFDLVEHSDDILGQSVKCLEYPEEDRDAYARLLRRLTSLSKGAVPLENIESVANFDEETAVASFDLEGERLTWSFDWNGAYLDLAVFSRFDDLLHTRSGSRLYILNDDPREEEVLVVILSEEQHRGLEAAGAPLTRFAPARG